MKFITTASLLLMRRNKPIMKNLTGPFAYNILKANNKRNTRKKRLYLVIYTLLGLGLTGLIYALLIIILGVFK